MNIRIWWHDDYETILCVSFPQQWTFKEFSISLNTMYNHLAHLPLSIMLMFDEPNTLPQHVFDALRAIDSAAIELIDNVVVVGDSITTSVMNHVNRDTWSQYKKHFVDNYGAALDVVGAYDIPMRAN